nr:MAG TPA: hypothetical protein [Crassvirales sp.]
MVNSHWWTNPTRTVLRFCKNLTRRVWYICMFAIV